MNLEQCETIIRELFVTRWPQIGPEQKAEWSRYFVKEVVWPAVQTFSEPIARTAATRVAQKNNYVPKADDWAKECKVVYAQERGREPEALKVDCQLCDQTGFISFYIRHLPNLGGLDFRDVRHTSDPSVGGGGWACYAIPCECENATEDLRGVSTEDRSKVIQVLIAFEAQVLGRDATQVSDGEWKTQMRLIRASLGGQIDEREADE